MKRDNFNVLLRCGKLFHQCVIDQYAKIEQERLNYRRFHQTELRAELYQGLTDAVAAGDLTVATIGTKIILPSSFIGGPRNMHQLYQDSMAIVRRYGKPDLFVTFTCNPRWPEIKDNILPGQQITVRPDVIVRACHLKSKEFINEIVHREICGKVLAFGNVIEFQKRGLPHLHMLIILQPSAKPKSPSDYDKFVSAEIPDPNLLPTLHQVVTSHMIHGQCGQINKNSPCMRDNKCTKRFPKEFSSCNVANPHGYPIYRRRDQHIEIEKHGAILDNRWIVPYNPYLSTKYQAHINVEICSSVTAVKYLYKYVYKGHDRIIAGLQQDTQQCMDEIQRFIDARYVSATEACWRIFHYDLHDRSTSIHRLTVRSPGRERVSYREGHATQAIQRLKDTLTAWFKAIDKFPEAKHTPYHNFPEHFTWNATSSEWKPRKQRHAIGRLYQANPTEGERFFL
ncbi:uncharacterized protein LOC144439763 [Glandiceps talaboti]